MRTIRAHLDRSLSAGRSMSGGQTVRGSSEMPAPDSVWLDGGWIRRWHRWPLRNTIAAAAAVKRSEIGT